MISPAPPGSSRSAAPAARSTSPSSRPPRARASRARIAGWRQRLSAHIRERLGGGGEGGIAAALATGDQCGIPEADAEAMRRSGLAHLLSVSGLHLTAVVGAVMLLTLKLLALSPALALRFRLDPDRRRRRRAGRHRLYLADRRRGADRPLLHRRLARPRRHRARPRGAHACAWSRSARWSCCCSGPRACPARASR